MFKNFARARTMSKTLSQNSLATALEKFSRALNFAAKWSLVAAFFMGFLMMPFLLVWMGNVLGSFIL